MDTTSAATLKGLAETRKAADHPEARGVGPAREGRAVFASILACVDGSPHSAAVLDWATALSRILNAPLRTLHVLDSSTTQSAPQDPLTWELRRREAQSRLEAMLEHAGADDALLEVAVGPFHDRLVLS